MKNAPFRYANQGHLEFAGGLCATREMMTAFRALACDGAARDWGPARSPRLIGPPSIKYCAINHHLCRPDGSLHVKALVARVDRVADGQQMEVLSPEPSHLKCRMKRASSPGCHGELSAPFSRGIDRSKIARLITARIHRATLLPGVRSCGEYKTAQRLFQTIKSLRDRPIQKPRAAHFECFNKQRETFHF